MARRKSSIKVLRDSKLKDVRDSIDMLADNEVLEQLVEYGPVDENVDIDVLRDELLEHEAKAERSKYRSEISKMTVDELKVALKGVKQTQTGTKATLIRRLEFFYFGVKTHESYIFHKENMTADYSKLNNKGKVKAQDIATVNRRLGSLRSRKADKVKIVTSTARNPFLMSVVEQKQWLHKHGYKQGKNKTERTRLIHKYYFLDPNAFNVDALELTTLKKIMRLQKLSTKGSLAILKSRFMTFVSGVESRFTEFLRTTSVDYLMENFSTTAIFDKLVMWGEKSTGSKKQKAERLSIALREHTRRKDFTVEPKIAEDMVSEEEEEEEEEEKVQSEQEEPVVIQNISSESEEEEPAPIVIAKKKRKSRRRKSRTGRKEPESDEEPVEAPVEKVEKVQTRRKSTRRQSVHLEPEYIHRPAEDVAEEESTADEEGEEEVPEEESIVEEEKYDESAMDEEDEDLEDVLKGESMSMLKGICERFKIRFRAKDTKSELEAKILKWEERATQDDSNAFYDLLEQN